MPTKTNRRGFLATLLAGMGMAKWADAHAKSKVGPKPLLAHVSEIGEWPADDPSIKAVLIKSRQVGMTSLTSISFHETHAAWLKLVKSPEYQNSPNVMYGWAKK